MQFVWRINCIA